MPAPHDIGPYRIVRPLGEGGMGAVYLARDDRLDRPVAIKLFSGADARSLSARQDLLNEARAAAAFNHPHIASVHDVIDTDGEVAIVFEYVEGETLARRLTRAVLPPGEAIAVGLQLADALVAAHQRGIVHRDLKPANVAITPEGVVKVLDFGVARVMPDAIDRASAARTTAAGFVGTLGYAAPEQCLGRAVDARADIFSLGVVLFEMLTGRLPFVASDSPSLVRQMLSDPAPRVRTIVPGVPGELDALITRMLALDPAKRPASAKEVRDGLRGLAPTERAAGTATTTVRHPWAIAALAVAAGITGALVSTVNRSEPPPAPQTSPVVAVLPLTNASGDASKDYLAVGVADSLVTRLASVPSVTVLSRATVVDARRRTADIPSLARELDVTYFVDGTVQQIADGLQISLSLVDRMGRVAWGNTVEGSFSDVFGIQTRMASSVAQALSVHLSAADRASFAAQPTMNADALAAYWRGRALLARRDVKANLDAALTAFDEAIQLDPAYAEAHAARGEALWASYLETRDATLTRAAIDAGLTALRLKPESAEVRYALAMTLSGTGQVDGAIQELQRALALRPNFEDARIALGSALARRGSIEAATAEFRKVTDTRPNYAPPYSALGTALYEAGKFREAAEAFERVTVLQPDNVIAHQQTGVAYHSLGQIDRALEFYRKALSIRPYAPAYSNIGAIHHSRGEYEQAVAAYKQAIEIRPNARETHRNLGDAYTRMGRGQAARLAYLRAIQLAEADLAVNPKDGRILASLAVYLQKAGRGPEALRRIDEAVGLAPSDFEVRRRQAQVYALAGRKDAALDALEVAIRQGLRQEAVRNDDEFASLRVEPRFKLLVGG